MKLELPELHIVCGLPNSIVPALSGQSGKVMTGKLDTTALGEACTIMSDLACRFPPEMSDVAVFQKGIKCVRRTATR